MFRQLFCAHNAAELDELLHANPIYRRPERRPERRNVSTAQRSPSNYSAVNPLLSSSSAANIGKYDYLINKPGHFLAINNQNVDSSIGQTQASYNDNMSPIIWTLFFFLCYFRFISQRLRSFSDYSKKTFLFVNVKTF